MGRATTGSFVLTLPLRYEPWQRDRLDKIFNLACIMANNLIADRKKALEQLVQTREWKIAQENISAICKKYAPEMSEFKKLKKKKKKLAKNKETLSPEDQARFDVLEKIKKERDKLLKPWDDRKKAICEKYGISEKAFKAKMLKFKEPYKNLVGASIGQKLSSSVWTKFKAYLFYNGEEINFRSRNNFRSIESKINNENIRFIDKDGVVIIGKGKNKMALPVVGPCNDYEEEALSHRVKYCRIIRIPWKDGWLYKLQLILEGEPPIKVNADTGELIHPMGNGRVGLDIGTQTIAAVGLNNVSLDELADKANLLHKEIRRVNRAMDRSRRAANPEFFNADGTIIHVDKLPKELLTKRSKRRWRNSKRYEKLAAYKRYLYAKLARIRKNQHQEMANKLLLYGSTFYVEEMNFQALAKKAKKQNPEEMKPGEKFKRRKRFGKSIANKAPATFLNILEEKVHAQGGKFYKINTREAKASQYNHIDKTYTKKKLSQRWNTMPDGTKVQRDLYSAFLLMNTNSTKDGFNQSLCDKTFDIFLKLHNAEIQRLRYIHTPSSTGVTCTV